MAKNPNNRRRVKARRMNLEVGFLKIMVKGFVARVFLDLKEGNDRKWIGGEERRIQKWVFEGFFFSSSSFDCCKKGAN